MRFLFAAFIWTILGLSNASAFIGATPIELGTASAVAGSATLIITTIADCPEGALIVVGASQVGSSGGATITAVDSAGNTYLTNSGFTGTLQRGIFISDRSSATQVAKKFLPSGGTITITYALTTVAQMAHAICIPGAAIFTTTTEATDTAGSGTSVSPTFTTGLAARFSFEYQLSMTILTAGVADSWTEATGYTSLTPVLSVNALRMAYQIIPVLTPTSYTPTNGASRVWSASGVKVIPAYCSVSSTGSGPC